MGPNEVIAMSRTEGLALVIAGLVVAVLVVPFMAIMISQVRRQGNLVYDLAKGIHGNGQPDDKGLRGDVQKLQTENALAHEDLRGALAESKADRVGLHAEIADVQAEGHTAREESRQWRHDVDRRCTERHPEAVSP